MAKKTPSTNQFTTTDYHIAEYLLHLLEEMKEGFPGQYLLQIKPLDKFYLQNLYQHYGPEYKSSSQLLRRFSPLAAAFYLQALNKPIFLSIKLDGPPTSLIQQLVAESSHQLNLIDDIILDQDLYHKINYNINYKTTSWIYDWLKDPQFKLYAQGYHPQSKKIDKSLFDMEYPDHTHLIEKLGSRLNIQESHSIYKTIEEGLYTKNNDTFFHLLFRACLNDKAFNQNYTIINNLNKFNYQPYYQLLLSTNDQGETAIDILLKLKNKNNPTLNLYLADFFTLEQKAVKETINKIVESTPNPKNNKI